MIKAVIIFVVVVASLLIGGVLFLDKVVDDVSDAYGWDEEDQREDPD